MDFRELTYVVAVAECGGITEAAKQLYISQPSLSAAIARIEADIGAELFDRSKKPLVPTYAGEVYIENARRILQLGTELRKRVHDISENLAGKVLFGIPAERAGYMLPDVIRSFQQDYPKAKIVMRNGASALLLEALKKDQIDFAVLPKDAAELPDGFEAVEIFRESLYAVAITGYIESSAITEEGYLPLTELANYPLIALQQGHALRRRMDRLIHANNLNVHRIMELESCISAVQFAAAGIGVAVVPKRAVEVLAAKDSLSVYQTGGELDYWTISLIKKKDVYLTILEQRFIERLLAFQEQGMSPFTSDSPHGGPGRP